MLAPERCPAFPLIPYQDEHGLVQNLGGFVSLRMKMRCCRAGGGMAVSSSRYLPLRSRIGKLQSAMLGAIWPTGLDRVRRLGCHTSPFPHPAVPLFPSPAFWASLAATPAARQGRHVALALRAGCSRRSRVARGEIASSAG